jgi:two-component system LytT family sensor kinase
LQKTPFSINKSRISFVTWWLLWAALHAGVMIRLDFPVRQALIDSLVSTLLIACGCLAVSNNFRFYLPQKTSYQYLCILSVTITVICVALERWLLPGLIDDTLYTTYLMKSLPIRFAEALLLVATMGMISIVWYILEEQKDQDKRKAETEKLSREAELYKIRQQMQPHFLFNSLNSISALVFSSPELARKMIQQLSEFLRSTLRKDEQQWVTLRDEMEYLELYLSIEEVRFGHRLSTVVERDASSEELRLPTMLLQPIVENAIKFGLYDTTGDITIYIRASLEDNYLIISVQNPYDPETASSVQGTGFGLNSVHRRLQLLFGRNDLLSVTAINSIFTTVLKIPQA